MTANEKRAIALLKTLGLVAEDGVYLRWMEAAVKVFDQEAERRGEERERRKLRTRLVSRLAAVRLLEQMARRDGDAVDLAARRAQLSLMNEILNESKARRARGGKRS